jgi:hypothetical protein
VVLTREERLQRRNEIREKEQEKEEVVIEVKEPEVAEQEQ